LNCKELDYQDLGGLSEKMPSGRAPQVVEEAARFGILKI
jgi:hypothetical protein